MTAVLPVELWLNVLEQTSIIDGQHLWTVVRRVSRVVKHLAEKSFISTHLPGFAISLSLPRRDPSSSALLWPSAIPQAQLVLPFDRVALNHTYALFVSPDSIGKDAEVKSVEDLRLSNVLPRERLLEAPAWVFVNKNQMTGLHLDVRKRLAWDDERRSWVWEVNWKMMASWFYRARTQVQGRRERLQQGEDDNSSDLLVSYYRWN
jgi:hypothetical protein